ncbi:unnamed protein product [Discosporangium mesarthrocarpum]
MLSRTHQAQQTQGGVAIGGQYESIFKTLMNKIKTLEINQSLFNLYIENLHGCYSGIVQEMLVEVEQAGVTREELDVMSARVLEFRHLIQNDNRMPAVQALQVGVL